MTVHIELHDQVLASRVYHANRYDPSTRITSLVWNVGRLDGGTSRRISVRPKLAPGLVTPESPSADLFRRGGDFLSVRARAEITSDAPPEPPALLHNNTAEAWAAVTHIQLWGPARANVDVEARLDSTAPRDGDAVGLSLTAVARSDGVGRRHHPAAYGVTVRVRLPQGLGQPTARTPDGTTFSPVRGHARTWDWNVGALRERGSSRLREQLDLTIPVISRALLDGKCIAADVTVERPYNTPSGSSAEVCFGKQPTLLLQTGETDLFTLYPCVGVSIYPCTSAGTLEVVAIGGSAVRSAVIRNQNRNQNPLLISPDRANTISPDRVIVHVPDRHAQTFNPGGRVVDHAAASVNAGRTPSWQTANTVVPPAHGVGIALSLSEFNDELSDWNSVVETMRVRGVIDAGVGDQVCDPGDPSPPCAPGRMKIRFNFNGSVFFDPNPTVTTSPFPLDTSSNPSEIFAEFETLGTYVVEYEATATHTDTTTYPDGLTGTGTYTFHVGPVAELGVRDGGAVHGLAADRHAIMVVASNRGPDDAPGAEVAIDLTLPEGVTVESHIASAGSYENGVWVIGRLREKGYFPAAGRRLDGEDLVLILQGENAAAATATVSIASTEDYTVCIHEDGRDVLPKPASRADCEVTSGNSWHSTHYFDYIDENNTAAITALPGTGAGAPGQPRTPRVLQSTDPRVAIVSWERVERLNDWPVEKYEVHKSALPCERPSLDPPMGSISVVRGDLFLDEGLNADACYAVRAVNDRGGKGYWSRLASTRGGATLGGLDASTREISVAENYGQDTYTIVLDGQPSNDVRVRITSTDDDIAFVRPGAIVFTTTNWDVPRTITVVGQPDDVDNPNDRRTAVIQHALSGGGADGAVTPAVQVTVIDDDGARKATISKSSLSLAEASGSDSYTVSLSAPPTSAVDLTITASNGAVAVASTSLRFEVGEQHQTITVTAVDDAIDNVSDRTAIISHTLSGGGYGGVTVPNVSVTVLDDDDAEDAPSISKSADSLTVSEAGGTESYTVSLSREPTGIVVVSTTVSGDTGAVRVAPSALTFTPQDWSQPKTVTVVGQDDRTVGTRRASIAHSVAGGGYSGVTLGDVTIIVSDNDEAGITLSTRRISLEEAPGQSPRERATYEISLSSRPTSDVTVQIETDPVGVVRMQSEVTFKPNEWNIPKPVTVIVIDDGLDNPGGERTATITHTASGGGFGGVSAEIAVTVADDDEPGLRLGVCAGGEYGNQHCHPGNVTWVEPGGTIEWSRSGANGRFGGNDDRRGAEDPPGTGFPKDVYFCVDLGSAPASRVSFHVKSSDHDVARPIFSTTVAKYPDRYQCQSNPLTALRPGGLASGANPNLAIAFPAVGATATITLEILTSRAGDGGTYSRGYTETFTFRVVQ